MATENCSSDRDLLRFLRSACRNRRVILPEANPRPIISKLLVGKRRRILSEEKPSTVISKLSDDLLVEILIRVPEPRSACWCRSVCKRWNALLSGPYFLSRFVSHHQSLWGTGAGGEEPPLLHSDNLRESISRFLPLPADGELQKSFRVCDSFKDLFLCGFNCYDDSNVELGRSFMIYNLLTKLWVALPLAPERPIEYARLVLARLVCEPRSSSSSNFNLGDGQAFLYSEYRFRMVCIYQNDTTLALDVFCSESGEWTENALVLDGHWRLITRNVISCNGELFWSYENTELADWNASIVKFNPFHLDRPPTAVLHSRALARWYKPWDIFISQGALHIVMHETETPPDGRYVFKVYRLQDDPKSCRRLYTYTLYTSEYSETKMHVEKFSVVDMHPERPELVFLKLHYRHRPPAFFCCNTRSRELQFIATEGQRAPRWTVFQPRVSCWPTPIPRYEELRGVYNGSYSCLVQQSSIKATTPSETNCSIVGAADGVDQFGHGCKDKRSALHRRRRSRRSW